MPLLASDVTRPSTDEVHALIPQRPAFTGESHPSIAEVTGLIDSAVASLAAELSDNQVPDKFVGKVRFIITLNAASLVESAYFPEQQRGDSAPAEMLWRRYQSELLGLRTLLGEDTEGGHGTGTAVVTSGLVAAAREQGLL